MTVAEVQRDDNHVYRVDGEIKPGVTDLLKNAGLLRGIEFVSEEALWRGKVVHEICRLINKKTLDENSLQPETRPYADAYQLFLSETGFEPHMWELMLYHPTFNFCGQFDVLGRVGNEWWLLDFKSALSCRSIGKWVGYQLALYHILIMQYFPEIKNIRRFGLKLMKTGKYNLVPFSDASDYVMGLACINVKNGKV